VSRAMARMHLLRVFVGDDGAHGNRLAVFSDGAQVPEERRQAVAADLGLSETVFVDADRVRIFTPATELDFAGHPAVGTAWLLRPVPSLRVAAGEVPVRHDGELTFVAARPEWGPPFRWERAVSPDDVDALSPPAAGTIAWWAWLDEPAGVVRARVFVPDIGIAEDEATGSAATKLAAALGREVDIRQGRGSRIVARPLADGLVEIGGRVVLDDERDYDLGG
jgi:predicted PhzF superfamily epimerase YddE/YHI9